MRNLVILFAHSTLIAAYLMTAGCANLIGTSTEFKAWKGDDIHQGKSGSVMTHKGVEYWEYGEPNKAYKIVGIITQAKRESYKFLDKFNREEIFKIVLREKGDGVVLIKNQRLGV